MSRARRLLLALCVDLVIAAGELAGGLIAHSTGLLATAGHDLADAGALGLALVAVYLVRRPATPSRSFGYHRVTILTALVNAVAIVVVTVLVVIVAVHRIEHPSEVKGGLVMIFAGIALIGNALAALLLRDGSRDLNMRAATLHLAGDTLAALGVLGAGAVIFTTGRFLVLDPVISLVISAVIAVEAVVLVRQSVEVLLESTPSDIDLSVLRTSIGTVAGVTDVHDLHCWSLSSEMRAISAHVVVAGHPSLEGAQLIGDAVKEHVRTHFYVAHSTIELECERCAEPDGEVCAIDEPLPLGIEKSGRH
ncbi:MAG: cation diffusion facilitator family transporter [Acidimicrobiales bacterium]